MWIASHFRWIKRAEWRSKGCLCVIVTHCCVCVCEEVPVSKISYSVLACEWWWWGRRVKLRCLTTSNKHNLCVVNGMRCRMSPLSYNQSRSPWCNSNQQVLVRRECVNHNHFLYTEVWVNRRLEFEITYMLETSVRSTKHVGGNWVK